MVDLNVYLPLLGVDLTGWTLETVSGISHDGSTFVGNGTRDGLTRAWLVSFLPLGEPGAGTTHEPPCYQNVPSREPHQENLVFITHGCCTDYEDSASSYTDFWVPFRDAIRAKGGPNQTPLGSNWAVHSYDWTCDSGVGDALIRQTSKEHGKSIGSKIARHGYKHYHLIAHSAGSELITEAAREIRLYAEQHGLSGVTIHTTYLDAYERVEREEFVGDGSHPYGDADWSDHYFSRELADGVCDEPLKRIFTSIYTQAERETSWNADVTNLDPGWTDECLSSHGWPRCNYRFTVDGVLTDCQPVTSGAAYGFPLSYERWTQGGGVSAWLADVTTRYKEKRVCVLPTANNCDATRRKYRVRPTTPIDPVNTPMFASSAESVQTSANTLTMNTRPAGAPATTPAWVNLVVSAPQPTNVLSFNMGFSLNAGAKGLVSVYIDGVHCGIADESNTSSGVQAFSVKAPSDLAPGPHVIGLRLDPHDQVGTTVTIQDLLLNTGAFVDPTSPDFDEDGQLTVGDLFAFLDAWFASDQRADFDDDGHLSVSDLFLFIDAWFAAW